MPLPEPDLLDLNGTALFLDLDGTVFVLAPHPSDVHGDAEADGLLFALDAQLGGRVAVLTGRGLADADRILGARLACVSGVHGLERRGVDRRLHRADPPPALEEARAAFQAFQREHPTVVLEDKGLGVVLHYRTDPTLAEAVERFAAELNARLGLQLQPGLMMVELRTPGGGKGDALRAYMAEAPFTGAVPVFVGDDLTDEHGFEAAEALGGFGIIVGPREPTAARFRLADVTAVRAWLGLSLKQGAGA